MKQEPQLMLTNPRDAMYYMWGGAFDTSIRTVLTGLTAICAFVYSCQTGLRSLTGVRLFSQDCPETFQSGRVAMHVYGSHWC